MSMRPCDPAPAAHWSRSAVALAWLVAALLLGDGCADRDDAISSATARLNGTPQPVAKVGLPVVQARVLTFENTFIGALRFASDHLVTPTSTLEERIEVLNWKINNVQAAIEISSGKNPVVAAIDFKVLVALGQSEAQHHFQKHYQDLAAHLISSYAFLSSEADAMLSGVLSPAQQVSLSQMIDKWRTDHPKEHEIASIRLADFASERGTAVDSALPDQSLMSDINLGGVFKLIGLDPMASIDPAVDQIAQARAFAETAVRNLQSMPMLLNWEVQVMTYQVMATPELRQILADSTHLTQIAEQAVGIAKGLPEVISAQREAIVHDLSANSAALATLLSNTRATLVAAGVSADQITGMLREVGDLTASLTPAPPPPGTPPPPPSKPFDILAYQQALVALGQSAIQLQLLVKQVHALIDSQGVMNLQNQAQLALTAAQQASDRLFNRLLAVGLLLIAAMTGGLVVALLVHRRTKRLVPTPVLH